jgi:ATP/ADP translocase
VLDNSLDYSLGNTAKQALWLPTSREAKYKAKQVVDSLCVRAGDVVQAGIVFAGERLAFTFETFASLNIVLSLAWIATVVALKPVYRATLAACISCGQTADGRESDTLRPPIVATPTTSNAS